MSQYFVQIIVYTDVDFGAYFRETCVTFWTVGLKGVRLGHLAFLLLKRQLEVQ